jgi:hypothetical protein
VLENYTVGPGKDFGRVSRAMFQMRLKKVNVQILTNVVKKCWHDWTDSEGFRRESD